ncbi:MAG: metallophosphoesterase [Nevskia sp.]|nr:metallophosphoesterase [Nevskia sp.]
MSLIRRLPDGPLDIVGDVHGELDALHELLRQLGYGAGGTHPDGRLLVFLGDLCDRGPDSPGVFTLVRSLVESDRACCLLGNHEMNLLRLARKQGNGWAWPEPEDHDLRHGGFGNCRRLDAAGRDELFAFIRGLPLALEREDLRIVHACWHAPAIEAVRTHGVSDPIALYRQVERDILQRLDGTPLGEQARLEEQAFDAIATDPDRPPPPVPNLTRRDELYQNGNTVRAITSGIEQPAVRPFFNTGKWRLLHRVRWWEDYRDPVPVVFGHYWRVPQGMAQPEHKGVSNLFDGYAESAWLGPRGLGFCVDYCVGVRFIERQQGVVDRFQGRLAALRWPEAELVMDDGRRTETVPGRATMPASA